MTIVEKTVEQIKDLKIQGASAIALASLNTLKIVNRKGGLTAIQYLNKIKTAINLLTNSRPTEPLNINLLKYLESIIVKNQLKNFKEIAKIVNQEIERLINLVNKNNEKIVSAAQRLIKNDFNIFTHCRSSLVEKILIEAKNRRKRFKVFNTETRPLFQGRIIAKNLIKNKIKVTMVTDSAAGFLISEFSGKELMMDLAMLGADCLLPDGSVINKIGSYGIGLSCRQSKVPLFIASTLLKFDQRQTIPIEIRETEEIWPNKPRGLKIINFAFDKIPGKFITGVICEFGMIKPFQVKSYVKKYYPWLL